MRVNRKVKIDGAWLMRPVPMDRHGKPDGRYVIHKGALVPVQSGTFYIAHGTGKQRRHVSCGEDPAAVSRALRTQAHVLEVRRAGLEVEDAPEIVESRRESKDLLRTLVEQFSKQPPASFTTKTFKKYENALRTFADWAAGEGVTSKEQVTARLVERWIAHEKKRGLDAGTIVPKVRIVLGELRRQGTTVELEKRTLPTVVDRERDIYTESELRMFFHACDLDEFELYQTYLISGMRYREVAFLSRTDLEEQRQVLRVSRKRELGFAPKSYEEREVPVSQQLVELLLARCLRLGITGHMLIFGTSREFFYDGKHGGKADKKHLDKCKQVARRSGLNCNHCRGSYRNKPVTCATHAVCRRWFLHKFRHTYATNMLRDGVDIVTVSRWLGHKDLATTRIYLKPLLAEAGQQLVESSSLARMFQGKAPQPEERKKRASRADDTRRRQA